MLEKIAIIGEWLLCGIIFIANHWVWALAVFLFFLLAVLSLSLIISGSDKQKMYKDCQLCVKNELKAEPFNLSLWLNYMFSRRRKIEIKDQRSVDKRWFAD